MVKFSKLNVFILVLNSQALRILTNSSILGSFLVSANLLIIDFGSKGIWLIAQISPKIN